MELLGRELGTHWADFGNVEPNPNRTIPWSSRRLLSSTARVRNDLIERALTHELDAEVRREFAVPGLRCTIEIPLTEEVGRVRPARYNQGDG